MSYADVQKAIEARLQAQWVTGVDIYTGIDVAAQASDSSYNSSGAAFVAANYPAGTILYCSGFSSATNNGNKRVVSATASKIIVQGALSTEAAGTSRSIDIARTRIAYENVPFKPENAGNAYIECDVMNEASRQIEIGGGLARHFGFINVNCYTQPNIGSADALYYAGLVSVIFQNQQFGSPVVTCRVATVRKIRGKARDTFGAASQEWYQVNVTVPFEWDA